MAHTLVIVKGLQRLLEKDLNVKCFAFSLCDVPEAIALRGEKQRVAVHELHEACHLLCDLFATCVFRSCSGLVSFANLFQDDFGPLARKIGRWFA